MPRADKAAFIQGMLSEHQLRQQREATKPVPDSKEWWRDVAQGLGVELTALRATIAEQAATIARLEGERLEARQAKEAVERRASNHESLWRYVVSGVTALTGVNYDQPSDVTECVRLLLADAEVAREGRKQAEAERDALMARVVELERDVQHANDYGAGLFVALRGVRHELDIIPAPYAEWVRAAIARLDAALKEQP